MRKFVFLIVTFLMTIPTVGTAAPEDCVKIESDVARLECFDNAFAEMPSTTQSRDELFARLDGLLNFVGENEDIQVTFSDCRLQGNHIWKYEWHGDDPNGILYNAAAFSVNLRDVDIEKLKAGSLMARGKNIYLVVARDKYIGNFGATGHITINTANDGIPSLQSFRDVREHFASVSTNYFAHDWKAQREINFPLIAQIYQPDRQEIHEALWELAAACQQ